MLVGVWWDLVGVWWELVGVWWILVGVNFKTHQEVIYRFKERRIR